MTPGVFAVCYVPAAREDLDRLFDFLLERAQSLEEFDDAQRAVDEIVSAVEGQLSRTPFIFRKSGVDPFLRELIVPFRRGGYVVLYEIDGAASVNVLAVRHQREEDYH